MIILSDRFVYKGKKGKKNSEEEGEGGHYIHHTDIILFLFIISIIGISIYYLKNFDNTLEGNDNDSSHSEKSNTETNKAIEKSEAEYDKDEEEDANKHSVIPVRSSFDNNMYHVAEDLPYELEMADLFASMNAKAQKVFYTIDEQLKKHGEVKSSDGKDITKEMVRLLETHKGKKINFHEYHSPTSTTVGSNQGKGDIIEICLRNREDVNEINDRNTIFRVILHELAHSADFIYREEGEDAHGLHFQRIHSHLLLVAKKNGFFDCEKYSESNKEFCGLVLTEDYCI